MFRELYPRAPWCYPLTDLRSQGPPELQVFLGRSVLFGMHVRGLPEAGSLLGVRVDEHGAISMLIADGPLPLDVAPNCDDKEMEC